MVGAQQAQQLQAQMAGYHFPGSSDPLTPETQAAQAAALDKSLGLLESHIGAPALAAVLAGGGYPIPSKLQPGVTYIVPREPHKEILVLYKGGAVMASCLVTMDGSLPWPDVMLQRAKAIQADETVVYTTGIRRQPWDRSFLNRMVSWVGGT